MSTELFRNKIKDNSRRKGVPAAWKAQRQAEAKVRQEAYDKLTPQQKLAKLDAGGFAASKQRAKLAAQIAAEKAAK